MRAGTVFQRTAHVCAAFVSSPFLSGSTSSFLQHVIWSTVKLPMPFPLGSSCCLQRFDPRQQAATALPQDDSHAFITESLDGLCGCPLTQPSAPRRLPDQVGTERGGSSCLHLLRYKPAATLWPHIIAPVSLRRDRLQKIKAVRRGEVFDFLLESRVTGSVGPTVKSPNPCPLMLAVWNSPFTRRQNWNVPSKLLKIDQ